MRRSVYRFFAKKARYAFRRSIPEIIAPQVPLASAIMRLEAQWELLSLLTGEWTPGDGRTLFLVGDPMQSIYRFREAQVALFLQARAQGLGNVKLESLTLATNFRSQQNLIAFFNRSFSSILPAQADPAAGAVPYFPAAPHPRNKPLAGDAATWHALPDREAEARRVVELVRDAKDRTAILVRKRDALADIVPALKAAGIRFRAIEIEHLGEKQVVQDLYALTRALSHLGDRIAWLSVLRAPWCGLSLFDLYSLVHPPDKGGSERFLRAGGWFFQGVRGKAMKAAYWVVGIFAALVVLLAVGLTRNPREVPSPLIGKPAPGFELLHTEARQLGLLIRLRVRVRVMAQIRQHLAASHGLARHRQSVRRTLDSAAMHRLHATAGVRVHHDATRQLDGCSSLGFRRDSRAYAHHALRGHRYVHAAIGQPSEAGGAASCRAVDMLAPWAVRAGTCMRTGDQNQGRGEGTERVAPHTTAVSHDSSPAAAYRMRLRARRLQSTTAAITNIKEIVRR